MPKRTDINKILIIGSGPIIIGQACEFDYSGTQACKALRKLGYEIVLVNSNPATIMTDPETADVTYIEPLNAERLEQIIAKERPDALLPNLGGQSGLNLCAELAKNGILDKYNVQVIGVQVDAIERGEDRIEFKKSMDAIGIEMARSQVAYSVEEALDIADQLGYPVVLRPAYTMGGAGGGLFQLFEPSGRHARILLGGDGIQPLPRHLLQPAAVRHAAVRGIAAAGAPPRRERARPRAHRRMAPLLRLALLRLRGVALRHDRLGERHGGRLRVVPRGRHRQLRARRPAHLLPRQVGVLGRPAQLKKTFRGAQLSAARLRFARAGVRPSSKIKV